MRKNIKIYPNSDEYVTERVSQLKNHEEIYKHYHHSPDFVEHSLARLELEQADLYILASNIIQNKATFDDLMEAIISMDFDNAAEELMEKYGIALDRK